MHYERPSKNSRRIAPSVHKADGAPSGVAAEMRQLLREWLALEYWGDEADSLRERTRAALRESES